MKELSAKPILRRLFLPKISLQSLIHREDCDESSFRVSDERVQEERTQSENAVDLLTDTRNGLGMRQFVSVLETVQIPTEEHEILVRAMCNKVSQTLSLTSRQREVFQKYIQVSKELSTALQGKAELHSLLTLDDPSIVRGRQAIAPIYSELFLRAVDRRNIASDSASHALSDVFHIARRALQMQNDGFSQISTLPRAPFPQNVTLPSWITSNNNEEEYNESGSIRHLRLDGDTLVEIEALQLPKLIAAYGEFFHYLWNEMKRLHGRKGNIVYEKLSPPWIK